MVVKQQREGIVSFHHFENSHFHYSEAPLAAFEEEDLPAVTKLWPQQELLWSFRDLSAQDARG